jgi:hypothetical protein
MTIGRFVHSCRLDSAFDSLALFILRPCLYPMVKHGCWPVASEDKRRRQRFMHPQGFEKRTHDDDC